ncbi:MAG TPA: SPOR domain-containing protein [Desulfobacterales bacterium]|nr:SPOR domain-containing protein [Desulfobacterales bacterium]
MAARKKKKPLIRLEMGWGGLCGFAVVAFCLLLWMFIFGIWTGQSVLHGPTGVADKVAGLSHKAARLLAGGAGRGETRIRRQVKTAAVARRDDTSSFYALRVAAFRQEDGAKRAVAEWRARRYEAFYLKPGPDSKLYMVYVGHIPDLSAARKKAAAIEEEGGGRVFINLLSAGRREYPPPRR